VPVRRAVVLLWVSLAIAICGSLYQFFAKRPSSIGAAITVLVVLGLLFSLFYLLIGSIRRGRNWARILLLVIVVGGIILAILDPERYFGRGMSGASMYQVSGTQGGESILGIMRLHWPYRWLVSSKASEPTG
jgi:hypothetical protein